MTPHLRQFGTNIQRGENRLRIHQGWVNTVVYTRLDTIMPRLLEKSLTYRK
jgi:hypothetical protein